MPRTVSLWDSGLTGSRLPQNKDDSSGRAGFPTRYLRFGTFELDLQLQRLTGNGTRVKMRGQACQALTALLENPGKTVTREALRKYLWPVDRPANYDASLNAAVSKLRRVLGDPEIQPVFIETIPRKGYRFIARVEFMEQPTVAMPAPWGRKTVESTTPLLRWPSAGKFLDSHGGRIRFTAGVIALVIASMLVGAVITLYANRPF